MNDINNESNNVNSDIDTVNSNDMEVLDESTVESSVSSQNDTSKIKKKKFKLTNKHIIIGAVLLLIFVVIFYFMSGNSFNIGVNKPVSENEEIGSNDLVSGEDGSLQEPSSEYKFIKSVEEKITLNETENTLLTYYYSDIEKFDIDGKEVRYYILKKEVFFNNYRLTKNIIDVAYSTKNEIDQMIINDDFSSRNRIIKDFNNTGEYFLYYYAVSTGPLEGNETTIKAMIVNSSSYILYNMIASDPKANGVALIKHYDLEDRVGRFYQAGDLEEVITTTLTEEIITYKDHSLYTIYNDSLVDVHENKIYLATINCREINEKLITIYNGVATSKYITTYYGESFIPGDLCKSSE